VLGILAVKLCPEHNSIGTAKQALAISSSPATWLLGVEFGSNWPDAVISLLTLPIPPNVVEKVTETVTLCPTERFPMFHKPDVTEKLPLEADDEVIGYPAGSVT